MNFSKHWAPTLDDYVIDLAWSPATGGGESGFLAAASSSGGITLFNAATGAPGPLLPGHPDGTNCLAWLPPADSPPAAASPQLLLASGGQDGCVRFWDATTGQQTAVVKLGPSWVEHLAWITPRSPRATPGPAASAPGSPLLFAAAGKKLVALRPDGSVAHAFPDAPKTITALAARTAPAHAGSGAPAPAPGQPEAARLASACFGGVVVWDAATFSAVNEYPYGNTIHALTWSPDGRWLVAGCQDNAVHLWIPSEELELHMSGYETKLKELSFSHDSRWLATGGGRDACVWDCSGAGPEGREPLALPQAARTSAVAYQNRHGLLATAAADGTFSLWAPLRKNPLLAEAKLPSPATQLAWSAADSLLAVGTEKGQLFIFQTTG